MLRCSSFAHVLALGPGRVLVLHAISSMRLAVDPEVAALFDLFAEPRELPRDFPELSRRTGYDVATLAGCIAALMERGFLTDQSPGVEADAQARALAETGARDPAEMLETYRRGRREGALDYWAARQTRGLADLAAPRRRLEIALLADCDLQMEAEFLSADARARGIDLRVGATFASDVDWVAERPFDAILVGALRSRGSIITAGAGAYLDEARRLLVNLRARSAAPILIDNCPEPTVQPLGLAERGSHGHRNRFRAANLALADLVEEFTDIHIIDVAAMLASAGTRRLVDDGLVSFSHFGAPGWMLLRPDSEKAAVHGLVPNPAPLVDLVEGDPNGRERIMARAHVDALVVVLGIDAKKAVIVDLDGVLWPGVLAETGAPFAWSPDVSGLASHIGLYVGLHEALKTLQRRGIVLAAASKNDETIVRDLWKFPENYPRDRLLTPDDFVTWRVDWRDKPGNIREIADELGFPLSAIVFIDDSPIERDRVAHELPEVEIWGEEPFSLRRRLLDDPRLMRPHVTAEAAIRTDLVKAQLQRERLRGLATDETEFRESLAIVCDIGRADKTDFARVEELFARTTQFNATGRSFSSAELTRCDVFVMRVMDRLADHGLVAAAVIENCEIIGFALSCRVIGLGVEQRLLAFVVQATGKVCARIVETSRNAPVRNLYRDGGFMRGADGLWRGRPEHIKGAV